MSLFSLGMFCLILFVLFVGWRAGLPVRFEDFVFVLFAGFIIVMFLGVRVERSDTNSQSNASGTGTLSGGHLGDLSMVQRIMGASLLPLVMLSSIYHATESRVLNRTMVMLSFRAEPPTFVLISDQAYQTVSGVASAQAISVPSCRLENDHWLLGNVTVVWHGVGLTSYLRLHGKSGNSVLIAIQSTDMAFVPTEPAPGDAVPAFQGHGGRC